MIGEVISVHAGKIKSLEANPKKRSAIKKLPIDGPVAVSAGGLEGDQVGDLRYHGGPFKAICCYASEFYGLWKERFDKEMPLGSFGENLALKGLPDENVFIGDVYTIGSVKAQVAGPRGPCGTLVTYWGVPGFHTAIKRERKTGFYLRVLEKGTLQAGDGVELIERPHPEWSLVDFWNAIDRNSSATRSELEELMSYDFLDPDWEPDFLKRLRDLDKK